MGPLYVMNRLVLRIVGTFDEIYMVLENWLLGLTFLV